jgi:pre-60S factor REI1
LDERLPRRAASAVEEDEDDDEEEEWTEVDPSEMDLADDSTSNMQEAWVFFTQIYVCCVG